MKIYLVYTRTGSYAVFPSKPTRDFTVSSGWYCEHYHLFLLSESFSLDCFAIGELEKIYPDIKLLSYKDEPVELTLSL